MTTTTTPTATAAPPEPPAAADHTRPSRPRRSTTATPPAAAPATDTPTSTTPDHGANPPERTAPPTQNKPTQHPPTTTGGEPPATEPSAVEPPPTDATTATTPAASTPNESPTVEPPPAEPPAPSESPAEPPPAPAGGSGSDERVLAALATGKNLTVPALAEATGLGKSTVAKALTRLHAAGRAARTPGGGAGRTRQPDTWNPSTRAAQATPAPAADRPSQRKRGPARTASAPPSSVATTATTPTASPDAPAGEAERRNPKSGTPRLAPGGLTQLVADHFSRHPNTPLTPGEVGRALNRSGGAVRNACDKLTADGALRLLEGTPRRYTTPE